MAAQVNNVSVHTGLTGVFDSFTGDPTMQSLTEDDINTYAHGGFHESQQPIDENKNTHSPDGNAHTYNYQSQAEQKILNHSGQRGTEGQGDSGFPPGFVQQFLEKNGQKYPKHPNPPHRVSDFAMGHRGCYYCGKRDHMFNNCKRRNELRSLQ